jgi:hypothetical protein
VRIVLCLSQARHHTLCRESNCHSVACALQVAVRDFEFDKLEFARPSRMNKVFILFSTRVVDLDMVFTIFEVPTVCFCRREQKERAYSKLGVPYRVSAPLAVKVEPSDKKVCFLRRCVAVSAPWPIALLCSVRLYVFRGGPNPPETTAYQ